MQKMKIKPYLRKNKNLISSRKLKVFVGIDHLNNFIRINHTLWLTNNFIHDIIILIVYLNFNFYDTFCGQSAISASSSSKVPSASLSFDELVLIELISVY